MISAPTNVYSPDYATQHALWYNQQTQDAKNQGLHDIFVRDAKNWVDNNTHNRELGLPLTPVPTLPLMTIYNDDGSVSNPPFPDLILPSLPPVVTNPPPKIGDPTQAPPDRIDYLIDLCGRILKQVTK